MAGIETLFLLLLAAVLLVAASQWARIPYPIALVIGGMFIGFLPHVPELKFDPNLILVLVLPPILYYAAVGTAYREFQKNWRGIFSLALGLVLFTTLVIGLLFKWMFPEFPLALCFAFGAIISPPDAVSSTAILKRFNISPRLVSLLEGESLVNDASALVLYKLSLTALLSGTFSLMEGGIEFVQAVVVGILIGIIVGYVMQMFSRQFLEPVLGVICSFTIPYLSFLIAIHLGGSGVLAVVVCGLIGARILLKHRSSLRRVLGYATWDILIVLLNCFVFILIGLQLRIIAEELTTEQMILYSKYAFLIFLAMIAVRLIWVYAHTGIAYLRAKHTHRAAKLCPQIVREGVIISWSGMRGIVSLAVAIGLPYAIQGRSIVIFITFVVILLSLVIPGLTLPFLIRALFPGCSKHSEEGQVREQLVKIANDKLNALVESGMIDTHEGEFLRSYFTSQHRVLANFHAAEMNAFEKARLAVIQAQRQHLLNMWERQEIEDRLLNHMENELDIIEIHIARGELN